MKIKNLLKGLLLLVLLLMACTTFNLNKLTPENNKKQLVKLAHLNYKIDYYSSQIENTKPRYFSIKEINDQAKPIIEKELKEAELIEKNNDLNRQIEEQHQKNIWRDLDENKE